MTGAASNGRAVPPRRRVLWSEFVPLRDLESPALLRALAAREVALRVAVTPEEVAGVAALRKACAAAGVELGVWPLLRDRDGRWGSCVNAATFAEHARAVAAAASAGGGAPLAAVALDLEPPIGWMRAALSGRSLGSPGGDRPWSQATGELVRLVHDLRRGAQQVELAAIPAVVADVRSEGWQRFLGTPVDALPVDHVSVMLYSSLLEGYSRRWLHRRDARALVAGLSSRAQRRYGARAGVSLGIVGGGALGDEPAYREPAELAEDIALARASGIDALALYGLDGILARPPIETWLDVFVRRGDRASEAVTWRARATLAGLALASPALRALSRR